MERMRVGFEGCPAALHVELARDPTDRLRGLAGRPQLFPNTGMLFDMEEPGRYGFHMVGVFFPLDIIFVSDIGQVVTIHHNAPPGEAGPFAPRTPARWIVEAPGGWAESNGVRPGMTMRVF